MTKPQEYREQRTILHETHYKVHEELGKGPHSGTGILTTGRVVWIAQSAQPADQPTVEAFAEGIGVVSLNRQNLR